jgi:Tol biopolymer transport system component
MLATLAFATIAAAAPGVTSASRSAMRNDQTAQAAAKRGRPLKGTIALTAFTSTDPTTSTMSLYLLHLATRRLTPIRNSQGYSAYAWSPDGSRLLVSKCNAYGVCAGLYSMRADGSSTVVLTTSGNTDGSDARWSPDGSRVAFEDSLGQLWVVNADGSGLRLLTQQLQHRSDIAGEFSWAPNGKRIVFAGSNSNSGLVGLWTVTTQGIPTLQEILPFAKIYKFPRELQPTWSPDGSRIAFSAAAFGSQLPDKIAVMRADGTDVRVLHQGQDPVWSPNGRRIAGRIPVGGYCCIGSLLTMRADGTHARSWLSGGETFSPNGSKLAYAEFFYSKQPKSGHSLYVANADGTHRVRVLHAPNLFLGGPGGPLWRGGTAGG